MQVISNRRTQIYGLLASAMLALCLFQLASAQQSGAQQRRVSQQSEAVVGLIPGQTLRACILNPGESDQGGPSVRGHVKVFDGRIGQLAQTSSVEIPEGAFHCFDIDRPDLSPVGDPRTGRLQVRVQIVVIGDAPARDEATRRTARIDKLPLSVELVDNNSGVTRTHLVPIGGVPIPID